MVDPLTTVGAGLAVLGSKDILTKILGPTADYIGGEIRNLVERCNINLDRIFVKAKVKLGTRINRPGIVNPRVLRHVLVEGRFCEDELMAEYYGGVLASSRSDTGRDDRGVTHLSTISSLSSYQIRSHYIFYSLIRKHFLGKEYNIGLAKHREYACLYVPDRVYNEAMQFSDSESPNEIFYHSINGLESHQLILDNYLYGSIEHLRAAFPETPEPGTIVEPTLYGAELLLWACGVTGASGHEILDETIDIAEPAIDIPDGAMAVKDMRSNS